MYRCSYNDDGIRKRHLQKIEDYLEKIHKGLYIRNVNENALLQVIIDY